MFKVCRGNNLKEFIGFRVSGFGFRVSDLTRKPRPESGLDCFKHAMLARPLGASRLRSRGSGARETGERESERENRLRALAPHAAPYTRLHSCGRSSRAHAALSRVPSWGIQRSKRRNADRFFFNVLEPRVIQKCMSLTYEPSSEPLHISAM